MKETLKIAIIGYGKMGREIEKHALEQNIIVNAIVDSDDDWQNQLQNIKVADVAIEFTSPGVVVHNIKKLLDLGVPMVTGTTGWGSHYEEIREYCARCNGALFYASNFSIGVNLFFALNRHFAGLMSEYPEYSISVVESHHTQKLDAPSGTAISLIDDILAVNPKYDAWRLLPETLGPTELPVTAIREEGVTGDHVIKYESEIDFIEIKHSAMNRKGFAKGALMAARWLPGKKGIYTMRDLLKL